MRIFCDMDGVLADFDTGFERKFGYKPDKIRDDVPWDKVREDPDFFYNLPPMPDAFKLWEYIRRYDPQIITGVPKEVPEAPENKKRWIRRHLGEYVVVHTCPSRHKCLFIENDGDILIDDWKKHRQKWLDAGGRWITHISAENTILRLEDMGL